MVPEDEDQLTGEASALLEEPRRRALGHPIRRRILRALNAATDVQAPTDLALVIPNVNTSAVGYHLRVLEEGGCISLAGEGVPGDGTLPHYASDVADDRAVLDLLRSTRVADERDD